MKIFRNKLAWLKRNREILGYESYDNKYTTKRGTFDFVHNIEDANKTQHDAKRYFLEECIRIHFVKIQNLFIIVFTNAA